MENIVITGKKISLAPLPQSEEIGLWLGLLMSFSIYKFSFNGMAMLLLTENNGDSYTPKQRRKISDRIWEAKNMPCVFYFDKLPTYERDRLVAQGVYFIVGNSFTAIPTLLMNRLSGQKNFGDRLRPAAQYLLLYHIQRESLNGKSIKQMEEILPYKYPTIANSVNQLVDAGLLETESGSDRVKKLKFRFIGKELWDKAQPVISNPIEKVVYTSDPIGQGWTGGISALSEYSMLAPEETATKVLTAQEFKNLTSAGMLSYPMKDNQRIEIWSYPPLTDNGAVDKLSLCLTLRDDHDPRVEKELENMMNQIW